MSKAAAFEQMIHSLFLPVFKPLHLVVHGTAIVCIANQRLQE